MFDHSATLIDHIVASNSLNVLQAVQASGLSDHV